MPQIIQIQVTVTTRYDSLKLVRREHGHPLWVDDGMEAFEEGSQLVLDLGGHFVMSHMMYVAYPDGLNMFSTSHCFNDQVT